MAVRIQPRIEDHGVVVRGCSPLGLYPLESIESADCAYIVRDDLVLTMTRFQREERRPYSEMEWAETQEIRLWASIVLSGEIDLGKFIIYPLPVATHVHAEPQDLADESVQGEAIDALANELARAVGGFYVKGCVLPPGFGGHSYEFASQKLDRDRQHALYEGINTKDDVLMRGLSTLVRSKMLAAHPHFLEEAAMTLFVSMEASLRLVLRRLRRQGLPDPTPADAAQFVCESFGEDTAAERYFGEYYDVRVATLHPESRFGASSFAPMQADDHYDLYGGVLEMYAYLILTETDNGETRMGDGP